MTPESKERRFVFIDTNGFISCAEEQIKDLNLEVLSKVLDKMENEEMFLVLPENIEIETLFGLRSKFKKFRDIVAGYIDNNIRELDNQKGSGGKVLKESLEKAKKTSLDWIEEKQTNIEDIVEKIFSHKATKRIAISRDIVLDGMRRATLKRSPFTNLSKNENKPAYTKDQDCIAFEAIINFFEKSDFDDLKFILCTSDPDFWDGDKLDPVIKEDLEPLSENVVGYENILSFLNEEFEEGYSDEQIEDYQELQEESYDYGPMGFVISPNSLSQRAFVRPVNAVRSVFSYDNNHSNVRVCSRCGGLFRAPDQYNVNNYISAVSSMAPIYEDISLCKRCLEESSS